MRGRLPVRFFGALAIFLLAATTSTSLAARARESVQLVYAPPAGDSTCPDEASVRSGVASQLGYDPFDARAALRVRATIDRVGSRLRGRVTLMRADKVVGERVLDAAADCASVANALAFAVALAVDSLDPVPAEAKSDAPAKEPEPQPAASITPAAEASTAEATHATESAGTPIAFRFGGGPTASTGVAPSAAFGAAIAIGVRWPVSSVGVEGRADLPAYAPLSTGGALGTSIVLGTLVPCAHLGRVVGCGLFGIGSLRGESRDVARPQTGYGLFGGVGARLGYEIVLSRALSLRPEVDALFAWSRPNLTFNGQSVWTAPALSGTLGLALIAQLGGASN